MGKTVILGCYRFIGIHLCKYLLEKGEDVVGMDWLSDEFLEEQEEKRYSFGRNANFIFRNLDDLPPLSIENATVCIPFHDFLSIDSQEYKLENASYERLIEQTKCFSSSRFFCFVPIQMQERQEWVSRLQQDLSNLTIILTPTILGSWQRKEDYFQKLLFMKHQPQDFPSRTFMNSDAVFVDDLIKDWEKLQKVNDKILYVKPPQDHQLVEYVKLIFENDTDHLSQIHYLDNQPRYERLWILSNATPPAAGLDNQIKHNKYLSTIGEWKRR